MVGDSASPRHAEPPRARHPQASKAPGHASCLQGFVCCDRGGLLDGIVGADGRANRQCVRAFRVAKEDRLGRKRNTCLDKIDQGLAVYDPRRNHSHEPPLRASLHGDARVLAVALSPSIAENRSGFLLLFLGYTTHDHFLVGGDVERKRAIDGQGNARWHIGLIRFFGRGGCNSGRQSGQSRQIRLGRGTFFRRRLAP